MPTRSAQSTNDIIKRFGRPHILVVGDLMIDEFIWGRVNRISPEAPVPVVWVQSESLMPGGAANVASNIRALGGRVSVAGVIGHDHWGELLYNELKQRAIDARSVVQVRRPTTVKTRVIAHHQQIVRVDREHPEPLSSATTNKLIDAVVARLDEVDAVIIEDYGKGLITKRLLEAVVPEARKRKMLITVDPKQEHIDHYRGVTALTPNRTELAEAVGGRELKRDHDTERVTRALLKRLACDGILVTLGEDGMWLFERDGRQTRIPTVAQEVFDVAGAGDTVIATFTLALASGASMPDAARLANDAAGIVVGKVGTAVATPAELRERLGRTVHVASPRGKLAGRSGVRTHRPLSARR